MIGVVPIVLDIIIGYVGKTSSSLPAIPSKLLYFIVFLYPATARLRKIRSRIIPGASPAAMRARGIRTKYRLLRKGDLIHNLGACSGQ
jgi:hypothetical protein